MNRIAQVAGAVIGGAALLGVGVAVGTRVNPVPEEVLAAAAPAQAPLNQQDQFLMQAFMTASRDFDALLAKAKKGNRKVGPAMTEQAVIVLSVKRSAQNEQLRQAADAASQAMLLLGAGLTADNGGAVQDGIAAYKDAQQKVTELGAVLNGETPPPAPPSDPASSEPPPSSSPSPAPAQSPSP